MSLKSASGDGARDQARPARRVRAKIAPRGPKAPPQTILVLQGLAGGVPITIGGSVRTPMLRLPADLEAEPLMKRFKDLFEGVEFPPEDDAAEDSGRQIRRELFNELYSGERRKG